MMSLLSTTADVAQEVEDAGRGRDAVLEQIDRLGDAPRALADVNHHIAHHDWRVLNILQIREAAAVAGALSQAVRLLRKIRRALRQLSAARDALMAALPRIRQSYGDLVLPDDTRFRDLCTAANFMAVMAWTYGVGSGFLREEVESQVAIVREAMPEPTVVPKKFRKRTISSPYRRAADDPLYAELLALLLSLQNSQRKVDRRLPRILPVVASLQEQAARVGEATHGVTRQSPHMRTIAAQWASALAEPSLGDSEFADVLPRIEAHLQELQDSLDAPAPLLYTRWFAGDVVVRSLRDVAEVRTNSRLLRDADADQPSHRITIVVDALGTFSEAKDLRLGLLSGVRDCGWVVVRGLPQLAQAVLLYDGMSELKAALEKAHTADNMYNAAGQMIGHRYFVECGDRVAELRDLFNGDRTVVSSGAPALLANVDQLVQKQLQEMAYSALEQLDIVCAEEVIFIHA